MALVSLLVEAESSGLDGTVVRVIGASDAVPLAIRGSSITVPSCNTSRVSARVYPRLVGASHCDSWVVSL